MPHNGARTHIDAVSQHHDLALQVFQFKTAIAAGYKFDIQGDRPKVQPAALAANAQSFASADRDGLERRNRFGVGHHHAGAVHIMLQQGAHHIGAVARPTAADIVGGFNQVRGAIVGGLILGVIENMAAAYISAQYRGAIPLILLIAVILWRPQGLMGRAEERTV